MRKKSAVENVDYTNNVNMSGGGTGSSSPPINILEDVIEEVIRLRKTVSALEDQLKRVTQEFQRKHDEILTAVSDLSKQVGSSIGYQEPLEMIQESSACDELNQVVNESINDFTNSTQDGRLVWKINDFEKRINEAVIGKTPALHSAPCWTKKYEYKFCLKLYLHGDGLGRGTHLSLFLVIMESEYDDFVEWPFQKTIKFKLINQKDGSKDHVKQMFPNKDSSSFQKPKRYMNIASGCPLFISLDRLQPEGFLKNGNLFLEIKIE